MSGWNIFYIVLGLVALLGIYLVSQNKWIQVKHFQIKLPNSGKGIKGKKLFSYQISICQSKVYLY